MQAVTNYTKDYDSTNKIVLDKIKIVVGTEAMNASMSSDYMKYCMYCGIPPNLYVLLQCMGRVDRQLNAVPGTHLFEIHLSLDTFFTMFIHIQQVSVKKERDTQLVALFEVLECLVIPTECMHSFFEHKFEVE